MALRVYQLAKQLGMTSKDLLAFLRSQGHEVRSHMSNLGDDEIALLKGRFAATKTSSRETANAGEVASKQEGVQPAEKRAATPQIKTGESPLPPTVCQGKENGKAVAVSKVSSEGGPEAPTTQDPVADTKIAEKKPERPPVRTVPLDRIFGPGKGRRPLPPSLGGRPRRPGLPARRPPTGSRPRGRPEPPTATFQPRAPALTNLPVPSVESTASKPKHSRPDGAHAAGRRRGRGDFGRPHFPSAFNRRRGRPGRKKGKKNRNAPPPVEVKKIELRALQIPDLLSVKEFGELAAVGVGKVIGELLKMGQMMTANQTLTPEIAKKVGQRLGLRVEIQTGRNDFVDELQASEEEENLQPRSPVITVMGHVDHGKTSLLDAIRTTDVVSSEAGGITQHIGASVIHHNGARIVFLDTPGHEAFTTMRSRGAEVTDIVVLVVAADDGVMPQTVEAINHAKSAKVPILVALNKIDKPGADSQKVTAELAKHGLTPEEWGGDTIYCHVSAKQKTGLDNLLDMILLLAELQELQANPDQKARGTVIEAELDKGRGPVATVLIQKGVLRVGDAFVVGSIASKVRAMLNDKGERLLEAGPSMPVEILGLTDVPGPGDWFYAVDDEKEAKAISQRRQIEEKRRFLATQGSRMKLEELFAKIKEGEAKELNLILKADVQGSIEAIAESLAKMDDKKVKISIVHKAVGTVVESDVLLAATTNSIIVGYNVVPEPRIRKRAEKEAVEIRLYTVIYELLDDLKAAMEGLLDPVLREEEMGRADVRQTFSVPKAGVIAGCFVSDGTVARNAHSRLLREGKIIWTGRVGSLKRFKDDVREVKQGYECGIGLDGYNDIKVGDVISFFVIVKERATLA